MARAAPEKRLILSVLLYSHTITPRLQYVSRFLSGYYTVPFQLTVDETTYRNATDVCKINYSAQPILENEIHMAPHALLFENKIKPIAITCFDYNGNIAFFKTGGAFPFDLFAAVFYLLSRYEEYEPHQKDSYGRYAHGNSIAFKNNFLKTPLINIWLEHFRTVLAQQNSQFSVLHSSFSFQPTYDIDIAWSYKAKGFKRTAGALFSAVIKGDANNVAERMRVLNGKKSDPFDAYDWLDNVHQRHNLKPLYFFLVAQQRGQYDKNPSPENILFQNLISRITQRNSVGLHPSWQSGDDTSFLQNEKTFLERHTQQTITKSRQHYIRFTLPQTFRRLIEAGITTDYSIGYGSINGFRASVAAPFYWYDLEQEKETTLLLHPFCFMDANSYYEQHQSPEETWNELAHYYTIVKSVNGCLCTIWHNHFLGTDAAFNGWPELYEKFVMLVCE